METVLCARTQGSPSPFRPLSPLGMSAAMITAPLRFMASMAFAAIPAAAPRKPVPKMQSTI